MPVVVIGLVLGFAADASPAAASTVYSWGQNTLGQLGVPFSIGSAEPVPLALTGVTEVAAGGHTSYSLSESGVVAGWGSNATGALGKPEGTSPRFTSAPIPDLVGTAVKEVSAGHSYALALLTNGTVVAWGDNKYGQLGDGTTEQHSSPVPVRGLTDVRRVVASFFSSYAILKDGQLVAWGNGRYGQLGLHDTNDRWLPTPVPGMEHVAQISGGCIHAMVLTDGGAVETSGGNEYAQLGHGRKYTARSASFEPVIGMPSEPIREISAGLFYSLAVTAGGKVFSWGYNHTGQLGTGSVEFGPQGTPRAVTGLPGPVVKIAGADGAMDEERTSQHTLAIVEGGSLYAWGGNEYGQLGIGTNAEYASTPTQVVGLSSGVTGIASGGFASLALVG